VAAERVAMTFVAMRRSYRKIPFPDIIRALPPLMTLMLRWAEPGALTKLEGLRGERIRKQSSSEDSALD